MLCHKRTSSLPKTRPHPRTHAHTQARMQHITHALTPPPPPPRARAHTHIHTHTHTHTHPLTHTGTPFYPPIKGSSLQFVNPGWVLSSSKSQRDQLPPSNVLSQALPQSSILFSSLSTPVLSLSPIFTLCVSTIFHSPPVSLHYLWLSTTLFFYQKFSLPSFIRWQSWTLFCTLFARTCVSHHEFELLRRNCFSLIKVCKMFWIVSREIPGGELHILFGELREREGEHGIPNRRKSKESPQHSMKVKQRLQR